MQDVTDPIVAACESNSVNGMTINIGPDEEFITINELAMTISRLMKIDINPIYMPGRPQEVKEANCSADLARNMLNYKTSTSLESGLTELIDYIREFGPKEFSYHLPIEFITADTPKTWTEQLI